MTNRYQVYAKWVLEIYNKNRLPKSLNRIFCVGCKKYKKLPNATAYI